MCVCVCVLVRYGLFDDFWGKDRNFFRKEAGDFLARRVAPELLNYSKNYLLQVGWLVGWLAGGLVGLVGWFGRLAD